MVSKKLILASSSPRRQELVRMLGIPVTICPAGIDETVDEGMPPEQMVETLSLRKAAAVCDRVRGEENGVVIGSDTVVVLDGKILGKPANREQACAMLAELRGRTHKVYSGIACVDTRSKGESVSRALRSSANPVHSAASGQVSKLGSTGQHRVLSRSSAEAPEILVGHTVSNVTFRPMSDEEIEAYVKTGEPLDKAGAYGVQGVGSVFVERIEGDFYSIMGLPMNLLYAMLLKFGMRPFKESKRP